MTLQGLLFTAKGLETKHSSESHPWTRFNPLQGLKKRSLKRQEFSTKTTTETNRAFQGDKKSENEEE